MTQFESLANELFYLVFEYLDACDIIRALSNLNSRFNALLAIYPDFKVNFRSVSKNIFDHVCRYLPPSHIQALRLSEERDTPGQIRCFREQFSWIELGSRLHSLALKSCPEYELNELINNFHNLTKLTTFSFIANGGTQFGSNAHRRLVQAISQLPFLRQCTIKMFDDELPFNDSPGLLFPSLECVCLGVSSLHQIVHLCRCAPNLKRLIVDAMCEEPVIGHDFSPLAHLQHLSINISASMDELERILGQARSLISLSLVCGGSDCCNGQRWQQLLANKSLTKFRFQLWTDANLSVDSLLESFRDKFWLERGWHVCCERQSTNGTVDLYTMPFWRTLFSLELTHASAFATTRETLPGEIFKRVREFEYRSSEIGAPVNNNYLFRNIKEMTLRSLDPMLPLSIVSLAQVTHLSVIPQLIEHLFTEMSMPSLNHLILNSLPETWTISRLSQKILWMKLRTTEDLTDEEIEAMCAPTSFAVSLKHLSLRVQSNNGVRLVLNRLTRLESINIRLGAPIALNAIATETWLRTETNLNDFILTVDEELKHLSLWIGKQNP